MKNCILLVLSALTMLIASCDTPTKPGKTIIDTVTIGSQVWMAKNLDVAKYRNGDKIPEVKDSSEWVKLNTGAWCYYNNDRFLF